MRKIWYEQGEAEFTPEGRGGFFFYLFICPNQISSETQIKKWEFGNWNAPTQFKGLWLKFHRKWERNREENYWRWLRKRREDEERHLIIQRCSGNQIWSHFFTSALFGFYPVSCTFCHCPFCAHAAAAERGGNPSFSSLPWGLDPCKSATCNIRYEKLVTRSHSITPRKTLQTKRGTALSDMQIGRYITQRCRNEQRLANCTDAPEGEKWLMMMPRQWIHTETAP